MRGVPPAAPPTARAAPAVLVISQRPVAALVADDCIATWIQVSKTRPQGSPARQTAQSTSCNPSTRENSLTLWLTTVAPMASAWHAIQRSLAPIGVARRFKAVV